MNFEQPSTTRTRIEDWFVELYPQLKELSYEVHPGLLVWDCDSILNELATKSLRCRCKSRGSFLRWCRKFVRRRAQQIRDTERLLAEYRKPLFAAILKANRSKTEDCAIDADDIFNEVAALLFENVDELQKKGTASLSTRLYAMARLHALGYHTLKRNRRHALVTAHLAAAGEIADSLPMPTAAEKKKRQAAASCS